MIRLAGAACATLLMLLLTAFLVPGWRGFAVGNTGEARAAALAAPNLVPSALVTARPGPPPVPLPPAVSEVLQSGVLIVVSKAAQRMYVFKDGAPWASSPVSTGMRGHATPAGVFPILQKKVFHRSNIYSNAPMPFMQRLTWSGIAIHAGHLPGYPASHGCIRLPKTFARSLYNLTRATATTVVITNQAVKSASYARTLALGTPMPQRASPRPTAALAAAVKPAAVPRIEALPLDFVQPPVAGQTIQLAAAATPAEADAHWTRMIAAHPELAGFEKAVTPAVVGTRRVYRLRATAPGAHDFCTSLKRTGQACFNVR